MSKVRWLAVVSSLAGVAALVVVPLALAQGEATGGQAEARGEGSGRAGAKGGGATPRRVDRRGAPRPGRPRLPGQAIATVLRDLRDVPLEALRRIEGRWSAGEPRALPSKRPAPGAPKVKAGGPAPAPDPGVGAERGVGDGAVGQSCSYPVTPCRIVDTRLAAAGALVPRGRPAPSP